MNRKIVPHAVRDYLGYTITGIKQIERRCQTFYWDIDERARVHMKNSICNDEGTTDDITSLFHPYSIAFHQNQTPHCHATGTKQLWRGEFRDPRKIAVSHLSPLISLVVTDSPCDDHGETHC